LIELLIVIAVMGILAALLIPVVKTVRIRANLSAARTELAQLSLAIADYQARNGYYPPDNPARPFLNQLYYELAGTTNNPAAGTFQTLDGSEKISPAAAAAAFGTAGFMNCDPAGGGSPPARRFLPGLKPDRSAAVTVNGATARVLICTVRSSAARPNPPIPGSPELNPWHYVSSGPTNNPAAYDLWTDIFLGGKLYRISN
jgi:type II secretory pathway pseudopilin PulG